MMSAAGIVLENQYLQNRILSFLTPVRTTACIGPQELGEFLRLSRVSSQWRQSVSSQAKLIKDFDSKEFSKRMLVRGDKIATQISDLETVLKKLDDKTVEIKASLWASTRVFIFTAMVLGASLWLFDGDKTQEHPETIRNMNPVSGLMVPIIFCFLNLIQMQQKFVQEKLSALMEGPQKILGLNQFFDDLFFDGMISSWHRYFLRLKAKGVFNYRALVLSGVDIPDPILLKWRGYEIQDRTFIKDGESFSRGAIYDVHVPQHSYVETQKRQGTTIIAAWLKANRALPETRDIKYQLTKVTHGCVALGLMSAGIFLLLGELSNAEPNNKKTAGSLAALWLGGSLLIHWFSKYARVRPLKEFVPHSCKKTLMPFFNQKGLSLDSCPGDLLDRSAG